MKKLIFAALLSLGAMGAFAQKRSYESTTTNPGNGPRVNEMRVVLVTEHYESNYKNLQNYLAQHPGIKMIKENHNENYTSLDLQTDSLGAHDFMKFSGSIGALYYKKFTAGNIPEKIHEFRENAGNYEREYKKIVSMIANFDTMRYKIERLRSMQDEQYSQMVQWRNQLVVAERMLGVYNVHFELNNSFLQASDLNAEELHKPKRWVNMPGIEYSRLFIENPKDDISASLYTGWQIKYIFTRGKDYFQLGALHADGKKGDSTFGEMFFVSGGQDFYSKHMGGGNHKFFNLYSGYTAGLMLASKEGARKAFVTFAPSIGVELFKTKHVLFDTKVSYFLPIHINYYENMRGLMWSANFNFVF